MKKVKKIVSVVIYIVMVGAAIVALLFLPYVLTHFTTIIKQIQLASQLGVRIQDYPNPMVFPVGYFYSVITPGMSMRDVHSIVIGYEQVFNCFGTDELYYYFSTDEKDAIRFEIIYDDQGRHKEFLGEDLYTRTLSIGICTPGLLEEKP